jgi:hypothetical protein
MVASGTKVLAWALNTDPLKLYAQLPAALASVQSAAIADGAAVANKAKASRSRVAVRSGLRLILVFGKAAGRRSISPYPKTR